jgi:hypothetical protein
MAAPTAADSLALAKRHLARVLVSWDPPEWLDLATFGFYAVEAAVVAAATHVSHPIQRSHPGKARAATELAASQGLTDVSALLRDLNEARKSEAYGDVAFPSGLDAKAVATAIQRYVDEVDELLKR